MVNMSCSQKGVAQGVYLGTLYGHQHLDWLHCQFGEPVDDIQNMQFLGTRQEFQAMMDNWGRILNKSVRRRLDAMLWKVPGHDDDDDD